ncbi:MAG: 4-hydroxy-tetrahydrodipicolinate synthase [Phycisphaeraceae bacterium]
MPNDPAAAIAGTLTAMITPFRDGSIDYARLDQQIERQIAGGVDGLVPCGTTGESPTLSHDEHRRLIEHVVDKVAGRVKVVAGTGSNATAEALELTRHAKDAGADAALVVNPYYNKPTQEGLYRHFALLADEVGLPIVLYNIPGRTGVALTPATVARLAEHDAVIAIKEATASMDTASEIAALTAHRDLAILSGDDSLTLPLMAIGGRGVISVLSNLLPDRVTAMVNAGLGGDLNEARRRHLEMFPLFKGMFLETNPIPIKTAMRMAGHDTGELRLPLCEMDADHAKQLDAILRKGGVL